MKLDVVFSFTWVTVWSFVCPLLTLYRNLSVHVWDTTPTLRKAKLASPLNGVNQKLFLFINSSHLTTCLGSLTRCYLSLLPGVLLFTISWLNISSSRDYTLYYLPTAVLIPSALRMSELLLFTFYLFYWQTRELFASFCIYFYVHVELSVLLPNFSLWKRFTFPLLVSQILK